MSQRLRLRTLLRVTAALAAIGAGGCVKPKAVDDFFPLAVGNRWNWALVAATGDRPVSQEIVEVRTGADGMRYLLDRSGVRYYVRDADGVALSIEPGIWSLLIQSPLTLGARFDGARSEGMSFGEGGNPAPPNDPVVRHVPSAGYKVVTGFDRTITVPAGTFEGCLEVTHVAGPVIGVKYFAPQVGLVLSESWIERHGVRSRMTRQELVSYEIKKDTKR